MKKCNFQALLVSMSTVREYGTVRRTFKYGTVRYGTVRYWHLASTAHPYLLVEEYVMTVSVY